MTEKKTRAKAVTCLDDIKARCVEIGDCWEWQGAASVFSWRAAA